MSVVMYLNGVEWFSALRTCFSYNSNISIFGSGSKWLLVVFTTFLGKG